MRTGVWYHIGKWGRRILKRSLVRGTRGTRVFESREGKTLSARVNALEALTGALAAKYADLDVSVSITEMSVDALWETVGGLRRPAAAPREGTRSTLDGETPSPDLAKKATLN